MGRANHLGDCLRARRSRVTPGEVGLAPGSASRPRRGSRTGARRHAHLDDQITLVASYLEPVFVKDSKSKHSSRVALGEVGWYRLYLGARRLYRTEFSTKTVASQRTQLTIVE